ncbi:hypothetical protein GHK92_07200 [Nocardioides sp. dk4132]|uniref:hypothetical protein n=1 Tax=unclassified Nocardioides TaxID=2615069 RepID=UPI00129726E7|nr:MULTISPECIES: hypothetical protein [unclassified Nocardioides]MQW75653.1 hypothetical protein [Nocardioides sp. dk4132]QGA08547.1 hypothetical protein GFH29_14950 [Nocardioides sp. dk884]
MAWEDELFAMLEDLEQQAGALYDAERAPELADRARAEYRSVTLAGRLMASLDHEVVLEVAGAGVVTGRLARVGPTWCLVSAPGQDRLVVLDAVEAAEGLSERAVPEVAWSPVARLGLASALRRLAEAGECCVLVTRGAATYDGRLRRVGADFVEVETGAAGRVRLLAFSGLAVVRARAED